MISKLGIGMDVIKVDRFRKIPYLKNKTFYKKNFSASEIKYCLKYKDQASRFSGKFAVKEAVIKSINEKIPMIDIITGHSYSKPVVQIHNHPEYLFIVTVSHEEEFAIAIVLSEKLS